MRILYVEDDKELGVVTQKGLEVEHRVDWVKSGEDAELALTTEEFDLVVLDVRLPEMSGIDLLNIIRKKGNKIPVILLTARDSVENRIEGLDSGADDYLVKPFDLNELKARIRALGRRPQGRTGNIITVKDVELDLSSKKVLKNGEVVKLSRREYILLTVLMENLGNVMSKGQIEDKLYGFDLEVESNTVEVYISHLRAKLGKEFITTLRGIGYKVSDE